MALSGADVDVDSGVIAAQTSSIQAGYVAESGATLVEYATPEETIAAVQNGEADAVLADGDYLFPIIDESGGDFAAIGEVSIGGGIGMGSHVGKVNQNKEMQTFWQWACLKVQEC